MEFGITFKGFVEPERARKLVAQAEDGIRDLVRSRGLGDVYKRQCQLTPLMILKYLLIATC